MSSADKLTIETPEQTSLEFPLAGVGSRFLAIALDTLLQIAVYLILGSIAGARSFVRRGGRLEKAINHRHPYFHCLRRSIRLLRSVRDLLEWANAWQALDAPARD